MADRTVVQRTPWWVRVLVVFVASRIVTTGILLYFAAIQEKNPWTDAAPGYAQYSRIWDGHWYYIISVVGYPSQLPLTADGLFAVAGYDDRFRIRLSRAAMEQQWIDDPAPTRFARD